MKITIISIFRDSEPTIQNCLKQLDELEKNTKATFEYFFYENDSKDKTKEILNKWMDNKKGKLICENINTPRFGSVVKKERFSLLAQYRNRLLKAGKPFDSDYALILDSDVLFPNNIIEQYLKYMKENVVMITPNILQNIKCKMFNKNNDSYYDCLALRDKKQREGMVWVCNPFFDKNDRETWDRGDPVEVFSAFGGIPIIKSEVLNKVEWSTDGDIEHRNFCRDVGKYGKILVIPNIITRVVVPQHILNHLEKIYDKTITKQWKIFLGSE